MHSPPQRDRTSLVGALGVIAFVLLGCATERGPSATIAGKVFYKGTLVTGGTIYLYPHDGSSRLQINIAGDGTFTHTRIPPGGMAVAIETDSVKHLEGGPMRLAKSAPKPEDPEQMKTNLPVVPPGAHDGRMSLKYVRIPARYADPRTSNLAWIIREGSQTRDFDLQD